MQSITQAVIMAAGLGTRLRPLTYDTPKPLLPVAGRPILEWTIERLPREISEVVLVVNYKQEMIRAHFGESWGGRRISYVEQPELLGTGDAINRCRPVLNERFLVLNGDDLYETTDLAALMQEEAALLVQKCDNCAKFGALRIAEDGHLLAIEENSTSDRPGLVNCGAYALNHKYFDYPPVPIKQGKEFGLPQTLVLMAQEHPVKTIVSTFWMPIGYPDDLARATKVLNEG